MMAPLLVANNVTSTLVVLACWWLAHMSTRLRPPGRLLAVTYSLLGLSVLFTMMARTLGETQMVAWMVVGSKGLLALTLALTIWRRVRLGER